MKLGTRGRVIALWSTLVPPLLLWSAGWPVAAFLVLLALHGAVLWGTLFPHSTLFGPVIRRLRTDRPEVWLTIDDGPSADTPALLELLDRFDARATFFLVGDRAAQRPDLVEAIRSRGHEIGNHSATHPAAWFWAALPGRIEREIAQAQRLLSPSTGQPPRWFRAVAGHANPFVTPALAARNLTRVSWSARGYDGVSGNVDKVVARIARRLEPGAIILLHEGTGHGQSVTIARRVLELLEQRGLRTVLPP